MSHGQNNFPPLQKKHDYLKMARKVSAPRATSLIREGDAAAAIVAAQISLAREAAEAMTEKNGMYYSDDDEEEEEEGEESPNSTQVMPSPSTPIVKHTTMKTGEVKKASKAAVKAPRGRKGRGAHVAPNRWGKAAKAAIQTSTGGVRRKPYRYRPGTKALREIRKYQKGGESLLPRQPMKRLFQEIGQDLCPGIRFTRSAVDALLEGVEAYAVSHFADMNKLAINANRQTIKPRDSKLALEMRDGSRVM